MAWFVELELLILEVLIGFACLVHFVDGLAGNAIQMSRRATEGCAFIDAVSTAFDHSSPRAFRLFAKAEF
jgi:hypothetical protein